MPATDDAAHKILCGAGRARGRHPRLRHAGAEGLRLTGFAPVALLRGRDRAEITMDGERGWRIRQLLAFVSVFVPGCRIRLVPRFSGSVTRLLKCREPIRKEYATPEFQTDEVERFAFHPKRLPQKTEPVRRIECVVGRQISEFASPDCLIVVSPPSLEDEVRDGATHGLAKERAGNAAAVLNLAGHSHEIGNQVAIQK